MLRFTVLCFVVIYVNLGTNIAMARPQFRDYDVPDYEQQLLSHPNPAPKAAIIINQKQELPMGGNQSQPVSGSRSTLSSGQSGSAQIQKSDSAREPLPASNTSDNGDWISIPGDYTVYTYRTDTVLYIIVINLRFILL